MRSAPRLDLRLAALCVGGIAMPWSKAGLSLGAGLLLLATLVHRRRSGTFATPLGWSALAMLAGLLPALALSTDVGEAWDSWFGILWPLVYVFLGAAAVRDSRRPMLYLLLVSLSAAAASYSAFAHVVSNVKQFGYVRRTLVPPTNIWLYATALASAVLISLLLARRTRGWAKRAGLLLLALVQYLAVLVSRRRMPLLLVTLAVAAWGPLLFRRGVTRLISLATVVILGSVVLATNPQLLRLDRPGALWEAEENRRAMWQMAWENYQEHPVFGIGLGDVRGELHALADAEEAETGQPSRLRHQQAHSNFLHTMAAAGTVGLLGVLAWLFALPAVLVRGWRDPHTRDAVFLGLSAWAFLFFGGITDATLYSSNRLAAFALVYAYAWGRVLARHDAGAAPRNGGRQAPPAAARDTGQQAPPAAARGTGRQAPPAAAADADA